MTPPATMRPTSSPSRASWYCRAKGSTAHPSATYSVAATALGACEKKRHCAMPASAPPHTSASSLKDCGAGGQGGRSGDVSEQSGRQGWPAGRWAE